MLEVLQKKTVKRHLMEGNFSPIARSYFEQLKTDSNFYRKTRYATTGGKRHFADCVEALLSNSKHARSFTKKTVRRHLMEGSFSPIARSYFEQLKRYSKCYRHNHSETTNGNRHFNNCIEAIL